MNEQNKRLTDAGWECSSRFFTRVEIGQTGVERILTLQARKGNEEIEVVSSRSDEQKAWEHLYMEAKRVDDSIRTN